MAKTTKVTKRVVRKRKERKNVERGACFKIAFEGKQVRLTVYGQGNGLGFDQYGANSQAKEGKNYEQLLEYYLTGVKVGE